MRTPINESLRIFALLARSRFAKLNFAAMGNDKYEQLSKKIEKIEESLPFFPAPFTVLQDIQDLVVEFKLQDPDTYPLKKDGEIDQVKTIYLDAILQEINRLKFSTGAEKKVECFEKIIKESEKKSDRLPFLKMEFESIINSRRSRTGFFEPAFTASRKNITLHYLQNLIALKFSDQEKKKADDLVVEIIKELQQKDSAFVWNGRAEARKMMNRLNAAISNIENGAINTADQLRSTLQGFDCFALPLPELR